MKFKLFGRAILAVIDRKGKVKDLRLVKNLVTNAGIELVGALVGGISASYVKYVAIGEGSPTYYGNCTAPSATDTALGFETCRKLADKIYYGTYILTNDTIEYEATFSSADGCTGIRHICEAGLFNASVGGTLFARMTFTPLLVDFDVGDRFWCWWAISVLRV